MSSYSLEFPGGFVSCQRFLAGLMQAQAGIAGPGDRNSPNLLIDTAEEDQGMKIHSVQNIVEVEDHPPWGLDRIDQKGLPLDDLYHYHGTAGEGIDIYIVDTGVNIHHDDFGGRARWGKTTRTDSPDEDDNGHGSHVAGIAAGGTFGVAKKANIIAVKVLDAEGHGPYSELIEGLQWAANHSLTTNRTSVVNLSIQGRKSAVLNKAIKALTEMGIHVTSASGNMGADACSFSPASVSTGQSAVISVGAVDARDRLLSFSNYGTCVSIYAPGKNIPSVLAESKNRFTKLSGTSMASPHVAGGVAVILSSQPMDERDSPPSMKQKLLDWATYTAKSHRGKPIRSSGVLYLPYRDLEAP
ncbi:serine protease [Blyttiomyces sp. JEL0837]|nr:serine protease [Blyttiomyces sp. JEL0837]